MDLHGYLALFPAWFRQISGLFGSRSRCGKEQSNLQEIVLTFPSFPIGFCMRMRETVVGVILLYLQ